MTKGPSIKHQKNHRAMLSRPGLQWRRSHSILPNHPEEDGVCTNPHGHQGPNFMSKWPEKWADDLWNGPGHGGDWLLLHPHGNLSCGQTQEDEGAERSPSAIDEEIITVNGLKEHADVVWLYSLHSEVHHVSLVYIWVYGFRVYDATDIELSWSMTTVRCSWRCVLHTTPCSLLASIHRGGVWCPDNSYTCWPNYMLLCIDIKQKE